MTTTPYKYPLEERKMHQSSGHQEPYKEVRIHCKLRYPFQTTDFFLMQEILFHFLWAKRCSNRQGENLFSSEGDPGMFAHPNHLPQEITAWLPVTTFSFPWEGKRQRCAWISLAPQIVTQIAVGQHTQIPGWILESALWKQQVNL